jgi:hypothetical protein
MAATEVKNPTQLKDSVLQRLADSANIAQFVSFDPSCSQRHARIREYEIDHRFGSMSEAAQALLQSSGSVNIRSFEPHSSKSRDFIYGLKMAGEVAAQVAKLAAKGLYTIINETIDVNDGGVSGVALGSIVEFAPGDTPRCVEKPGTVSMDKNLGMRILETVYGFTPDLFRYRSSERVEFSIHPIRRGTRQQHTIVWELEDVGDFDSSVDIAWPNRFSRFIGDKAFGLLVAAALDLPVPATTVFPRLLPPFAFGKKTESAETWIRTCPTEQEPGRYTTHRGWLDPFKLMSDEDPDGTRIASVLAQEGVTAVYSGSLIVGRDGGIVVQGAKGYGDDFMLGRTIDDLPGAIEKSVTDLYEQAQSSLGPVRFEWVHDGTKAWIVQLHKGATLSLGDTIFPGEASKYHRFDVNEGIEPLRDLIGRTKPDEGIILVGHVGITSHLGDLLRKARIPSRIESNQTTYSQS